MSSRWGRQFQISIFGESHGAGIGVVIDGVPAGFTLDLEELYAFLKRRAPGRNRASTPRQESARSLEGLFRAGQHRTSRARRLYRLPALCRLQ